MNKAPNLSNMIKHKSKLDQNLIAKWNSIRTVLKQKYILSTVDIKPLVAEKYRFDLEGLFRYELNIPEEFVYPHMIANDYDCSNNYDGNKLRFVILKVDILNTYLKLFTKK